MNAFRHEPHAPRGPVHVVRRSNFWVLAVVLIAGLELAGMLAVPVTHGTGSAPAAASPAPTVLPSVVPAAPTTHGDLVVTSGETFYIPSKTPPISPSSYTQGGNITVEAGGTLIVQNTSFVFDEFVGNLGTPQIRLSHIFKFVDDGTVIFRNSTLRTATSAVNPYAKLTVLVNGAMTFWNSKVEFPGVIDVGAGGDLTLNQSSAAPNPLVANMTIPNDTRGDFAFAPTLNVTGGGLANLFSSVYNGLYADNLSLNGTPGPLPLTSGVVSVANATNTSVFSTPTDSASLTQDYLYPSGIAGGAVTITYNDTAHASTTTTVTVWYGGVAYALGSVTLLENYSGTTSIPFSPALIAAVNAGGMMGWLNRTGDFGLPSGISVAFHITAGPTVPNVVVSLTLQAPLAFGLAVSGAGSGLDTVDSFLALNFSTLGAPRWNTHQLALSGGATAYLGNLTVQGGLYAVSPQFANGAITADASSHAYLFRWANVDLRGQNGVLAVPNATVTAPYAYGTTQLDNVTAQRANNLTPSILDYLQYWDQVHGVAAYGQSNPNGVAALLLASNDIYGASAPDGDYLGDYHVLITPPAGGGPAQGYNWSVSQYPVGVANGSTGYGTPTFWGYLSFPQYYAAVDLAATNSVVVTADNVTATTITIGQELALTVNVVDNGPAPIRNLSGTLYYNATSSIILGVDSKTVDLSAPGQTASVTMTWKVNETVVGLHGKAVPDTLSAQLVWNHDLPSAGGGFLSGSAAVSFAPSHVAVTYASVPPSTLSGDGKYVTSGTVTYNGSQDALVRLLAWPTGGGSLVVLNQTDVAGASKMGQPVSYVLGWKASVLDPGKSYYISVNATYNGVWANKTLAGTYEVPGPSATHFLTEKILGLAVWLWLVIAAAIVAAVLGFLFWSRRQAAGKLVECGECGNLVPEDSKVCPKCGAEFETDVVRCSRCSSTIPASSQFCPECAAQLLGKPGEGGPDPERQAYADFTERYRAESKKELGENYSEGAFWDWWKRQPSYTPFSQWKVQQGTGTPRAGMTAPPPRAPPPGGPGAAAGAGAPPRRRPTTPPPSRPPAPGAAPPAPAGAAAAGEAPPAPAPAPPTGAMKPCPNCGKEIPPEYLVCPFCGSVTQ